MRMTAGKRALDKIYKRRDRYEIPDWQRELVWDRSKKQELIDSILRGWKLPKFYFVKTSEDEYEVVDGQQRLQAIYEFFSGELPLSDISAGQFGGAYYKDLPQRASDAYGDFEIEYDEIEDAAEEELKQFFQRLQAGLPLTSSEKLNAVHSKLGDFCRSTAKHSFFSEKVSFPNTRYAHFDVIAKAAAIEIEGFEAGLTLRRAQGDLRGAVELLEVVRRRQENKSGLRFFGPRLLDEDRQLEESKRRSVLDYADV